MDFSQFTAVFPPEVIAIAAIVCVAVGALLAALGKEGVPRLWLLVVGPLLAGVLGGVTGLVVQGVPWAPAIACGLAMMIYVVRSPADRKTPPAPDPPGDNPTTL